jgi:hypothetical protein
MSCFFSFFEVRYSSAYRGDRNATIHAPEISQAERDYPAVHLEGAVLHPCSDTCRKKACV